MSDDNNSFTVTTWMGVHVSGNTATAVFMGHNNYHLPSGWKGDGDGQYQLTLSRAPSGTNSYGNWQLATNNAILGCRPWRELMMTTCESGWGRLFKLTPLVLGVALILSFFVDNPAYAYTYDRNKAVAYAQKYSCNGKDCANTGTYKYFSGSAGSDCTDFVSQALKAGGMPQQGSAYAWHWYWTNKNTYSTSWISVNHFRKFMVDGANRAQYKSVNMDAAYTTAEKGDVYLYDWGEGNGWSHVSLSTGWGTFGSYYDSSKKKNYNQITGGKGDKMAQHTTDRDGAPWNWGYQTQSNPKIRKKMKTTIIHFTP